jgi:hypothetical protein
MYDVYEENRFLRKRVFQLQLQLGMRRKIMFAALLVSLIWLYLRCRH